jgi:hypothetical protein
MATMNGTLRRRAWLVVVAVWGEGRLDAFAAVSAVQKPPLTGGPIR